MHLICHGCQQCDMNTPRMYDQQWKNKQKSDTWALREKDERIHEGFNPFSITPRTITEGIWLTLTRIRNISRGIELFHLRNKILLQVIEKILQWKCKWWENSIFLHQPISAEHKIEENVNIHSTCTSKYGHA